jgi:pSer/pThr/pTyr-binding forkhead associated (FHA) protein
MSIILITAQRRIRPKPSQTQITEKIESSTAPLLPKSTSLKQSAYLQLKSQPDRNFPLAIDDIRIGRSSDNTIIITTDIEGADTVSRHHARLYRLEKWILEDLGSQNGVYVNGLRTGRNYLRDGWEIGIGGVIFIFHMGKTEV